MGARAAGTRIIRLLYHTNSTRAREILCFVSKLLEEKCLRLVSRAEEKMNKNS